MKKLKVFIIIILSTSLLLTVVFGGITIFRHFFLRAPDRITESWQTVTIDEFGTFRVPAEWNVEKHDGVLYITDKPMSDVGYEIYIVGSRSPQPHYAFELVEKGRVLNSRGFLNTTSLFLNEYYVNGVTEEHYLIRIDNIQMDALYFSYSLFVWNREAVTRWHAEQIAKTFLPISYVP